MSIRNGGIRDQNRKLSKITRHLGRLHKLGEVKIWMYLK